MSKLYYWILIPSSGAEPVAVCAPDAVAARADFGGDAVALCAPTTKASLTRAGWADDDIHTAGEPMFDELSDEAVA